MLTTLSSFGRVGGTSKTQIITQELARTWEVSIIMKQYNVRNVYESSKTSWNVMALWPSSIDVKPHHPISFKARKITQKFKQLP